MKPGMHTHLDFCYILPGHTSSSYHVRLKMPEMVLEHFLWGGGGEQIFVGRKEYLFPGGTNIQGENITKHWQCNFMFI